MFRLLRSNHIEIDLIRRQLFFYQGNNPARSYPIAIGKPATPSPVGEWTIINKKILNYDSVFGSRWMGLSNPGYGIHGTNNPSSIGKAVSKGCIRMYNHDVEELFNKVSLGTPVLIYNDGRPNKSYNYQNVNIPPDNPPTDDQYHYSNNNLGKTYQIKSGDTLWAISQKFNIPLDELIKANPGVDPNNLFVGQIIYLPK